ncbi:MAG: YebC/PmpR family DNA-binding transcriptional regulator [bacterium]
MSGHSKWSTIKRQKATTDQKKGQVFTKLAQNIILAAKDGPDPEMNFKLRLAIDRARTMNMPQENIKRAIERGAGTDNDVVLEEVLYEAYGPGGSAILIECVTDNKNRTVTDVKQALQKNGGTFAGSGSVQWKFEQKGQLVIEKRNLTMNEEELQLLLIENGADDINIYDETIEIITAPNDLKKVQEILQGEKIELSDASLSYLPKTDMNVSDDDKSKINKLVEVFEEIDEVQQIYMDVNTD